MVFFCSFFRSKRGIILDPMASLIYLHFYFTHKYSLTSQTTGGKLKRFQSQTFSSLKMEKKTMYVNWQWRGFHFKTFAFHLKIWLAFPVNLWRRDPVAALRNPNFRRTPWRYVFMSQGFNFLTPQTVKWTIWTMSSVVSSRSITFLPPSSGWAIKQRQHK